MVLGTVPLLLQLERRLRCHRRWVCELHLLRQRPRARAGFRHWIIQQNNNSGQLRLNCPIKKLYIQVREILNVCKSKG
nr:MAG TPA: hypothetical protein [Caudoviricetes sp.]